MPSETSNPSSSSVELHEDANHSTLTSPEPQASKIIDVPSKPENSASVEAPPISLFQVIFIIFGSVASSVLTVLVNKHMMVNFGFNMILTLTAVHFFLPWLLITIGLQLGFSALESLRAPDFPLREKLIFCLAQAGCVGLNNASLQVNSVGTYQLSKLLGIPCLVIVQASVFLEFVTTKVKVILMVIIVGVGLATVTDVSASLLGTFYATSAVLSTVFAQIIGSRLQQNNKLTTGQLFYNTLLPQTLIVLAFAIPTEITNSPPIIDKLWSFELPFFLILSCICASGVNFFAFAIIGKMSPITLQVVGHMKTCLILLFGFFLFDSKMPSSQVTKNLAGAFIAMVGVVAYGEVKRVETYDKKQPQDVVDAALIACRTRPSREGGVLDL